MNKYLTQAVKYEKINTENKNSLYNYLRKEKDENALLLFDLEKLYPQEADFLIAIDNNITKGVMLLWYGVPTLPSVHLRAETHQIAKYLVNAIPYNDNFRIVSPRRYSTDIEYRYKKYRSKDNIYLMTLEEKNINNSLHFVSDGETKKLSSNNIPDINKLFEDSTETDKGLEEWVKKSLDTEVFFGYFNENKLLSIAGTLFRYDDIAMIGNVYTKKDTRRKGFATKVLLKLSNYLFSEGFKKLQLYVVENSPAHKLYKKIGFTETEEYVRFLI
ncbi:MAG: GNAT family N-acetyltransferase [Candidatus Aenigmarchaeota archaeon]|nr:GNAT family N-acetyltransferase [Candidatus Aenigmarchaeota archaeon]